VAPGIHQLPVPTPFAVGRVNAYLIDDDPLTLVDTGPNSGNALDQIDRQLHALGRRVTDLELLLVTHQHLDHIGLTDILARRAGADVAALDMLVPWLADYGAAMEADDAFAAELMLRHGIAQETVTALRAITSQTRGWGAGATVTVPVIDGGELALRDRRLRVAHRPGHSPSDTVFLDGDGVLLGGDHLLGHISSNPTVNRPLDGAGSVERPPHALRAYLESLRATQRMPIERVLPGHGEPFSDHAALIDERFALHERRAERIAALVAQQPRTAHGVALALWGEVAVTQAFLTLSEVLGHLDLLVDAGRVHEQTGSDGVVRFRAGAPAVASAGGVQRRS
jgi:glyoxylase-like metal-dependent hydrolase (beta-lactamase superfamily II)